MYLTTQALVIRVSAYNDTDAILTLLTGEYGKISAKVRGLRRKHSPLSASCQLLSYSQFTLFEYKDYYTVNEASTIEIFSPLRKELTRLSLGTYFAQAAEIISQEDQPSSELLSLTLNCLYALSELNVSEDKVKAVFELRAACLAGYFPDLSGCRICSNASPDLFIISDGVLECSRCRSNFSGIGLPVSRGVLAAMRYICYCPSKKLFSYSLPTDSEKYLADISEAYFSTQLERGFSALDFYKNLIFKSDNLNLGE